MKGRLERLQRHIDRRSCAYRHCLRHSDGRCNCMTGPTAIFVFIKDISVMDINADSMVCCL
jgi:hypothetical protein